MFIVRNRKYFYIGGAALVLLSAISIAVFGFNLGIDFKGGTVIEVSYPDGRPETGAVRTMLDRAEIGAYELRPAGEGDYVVKSRELDQDGQQKVLGALSLDGVASIEIERVNTIGPVIGAELKMKALWALALIIISIVLFVAFAFRHVSKPVSSWKYGFATIGALIHDVLVPAGIYVIYSRFTGAEIDLLFVTAILAILGYSVNDTIVVFDRVRENLKHNHDGKIHEDFEKTVGKSLDQTIIRSINTSMTLFLVLLAIFLFGGDTTRPFILVLLLGTIAGTYSSIFLAAPMLVTMEKLQRPAKK